MADQPEIAARVLGSLRIDVADSAPAGHDVFWVTDFPMFGWNEGEGRWDPLHHPFTSPAGDLDAGPGEWRSRAYDVVLDGWELGGGSIRINRPDLQQRCSTRSGSGRRRRPTASASCWRRSATARRRGGIAFGIDRTCGAAGRGDSIRDAIAFPKTASGADPLTGAPAPVDARQLRELGIKVDGPRA